MKYKINRYCLFFVAMLLVSTSVIAEVDTPCTEITAVPIVIRAPGYYCLKKQIMYFRDEGSAIDIRADDVTIDLNGFSLTHVRSPGNTNGNSIGVVSHRRSNLTIKNGNLRHFSTGVSINGALDLSYGHTVENLVVTEVRRTGIHAEGHGIVIKNNRVIVQEEAGRKTYGVYSWGTSHTIHSNMIFANPSYGSVPDKYGIFILSKNSSIYDNYIGTFYSANFEYHGIYLDKDVNGIVTKNIVSNTSGFGLSCESSRSAISLNNYLSNTKGIKLCAQSQNNVQF